MRSHDIVALGAVLARPEVQERRRRLFEEGRWMRAVTLAEHRARQQIMAELVNAHEALRCQQRLDVVARRLSAVIDDLELTPTTLARLQAAA